MLEYLSIILSAIAIFISILGYLRSVKLGNPLLNITTFVKEALFHDAYGGYDFLIHIVNEGERCIELTHPVSVVYYNVLGKKVGNNIITEYESDNKNILPIELSKDKVLTLKVSDYEVSRKLNKDKGTYNLKFRLRCTRNNKYESTKLKFKVINGKIHIRNRLLTRDFG